MRTHSATTLTPRRRAAAVVSALVLAGLLLTGCAGRGGSAATMDVETITPTASATPTTEPAATDTPTADPGEGTTAEPACWTLAVPDVTVAFTQTPEEFAATNPGLVASGAPSPCSLFASGSELDAAEQWFEGLVADGWQPEDAVEDDVYVSRNATSSSGVVAGYLVSKDSSDPAAVTQFLTYTS